MAVLRNSVCYPSIPFNSVTLSLSFYKSQPSKLAGRSSASFHLTTTIVKLVIIILGLQRCRVIQYITHYTHACCGFCTQRILRLLWQLMLYVKTARTRCKDGLYIYIPCIHNEYVCFLVQSNQKFLFIYIVLSCNRYIVKMYTGD